MVRQSVRFAPQNVNTFSHQAHTAVERYGGSQDDTFAQFLRLGTPLTGRCGGSQGDERYFRFIRQREGDEA